MLQWMGGSRRKVATSRKSTQKRQKQYFEQRKRQQEQQTAGVESFSDGMSSCSPQQKNNRSLDILSLLNLSTVTQERTPIFPNARENPEDDGLNVSYQVTKCSPPIKTNKLSPVDAIEFKNARNTSSYQVESVLQAKVQGSATDRNRGLHGNDDKTDQLNLPSGHQLSVIDLLGDDGQNGNSELSPVHEAHVAFSIEGLGKVETETPVHSPQQPSRIFSYGCSSPLKAAKRAHSSKNLNNVMEDIGFEVDVMMQDINMPFCGSSLELPSYSRRILESFSNPKPKENEFYGCLDGNGVKMKNSFGDEEFFYNIEGRNENTWRASFGYLDHNFLDERDCDISWKNWPSDVRSSSTGYWNFGDQGMSDFAFEGLYMDRRRATKKESKRFNKRESVSPYSENQAVEDYHDFATPDRTWYPKVGRNHDVKDVINQPAWSSFATEDAKESLSLHSEESCSSSAVRGNTSNRSPPNSIARPNRRRRGSHHRGAESKYDVKNTDAEVTYCKNGDRFMSNPSKSRPAHYLDTAFKQKLGLENSCLFEEPYYPVDVNSGFGFLCQTSRARKYGSSSGKDPFSTYPVPELHGNAKSVFERSKLNISAEASPSSDFFSEKFPFHQSFGDLHSCKIHISSNIGSGPRKPNLSPVLNVEGRPQDSFHISGSQEERKFPFISVHESCRKDGESKFELQEEVCFCVDGLSSDNENEQPMEASDSEDNRSDCKEANTKTPDVIEGLKATCSSEHTVENSSSVKIPDELESSVGEKEYDNDLQMSVPSQNVVNIQI